MNHLVDNNILNIHQYAYQSGRSTVSAARDLKARVLAHLDGGRQVAAVFCDLSRAFEMVDHQLLLKKMWCYGVGGNFHKLIASLLKNRVQRTHVLNSKSSLDPTGECAVPQGSMIGNYLFLLLINDITAASSDAEYVTYADDTCIIVNDSSIENLTLKLTHVMTQISKWFRANGMLLNVEKTNLIHFQL
ncbi:uncharacterized protein LOC134756215 [Cydia strobilella]|uniref:uncharacterized protein LOC134756215 n=1 Tax=Cydia strobilella TaxID=1100964 RepID=UPI0030056493